MLRTLPIQRTEWAASDAAAPRGAPVGEDEAINVQDEGVRLARLEERFELALQRVQHPVAHVRLAQRARKLHHLLSTERRTLHRQRAFHCLPATI